MKGIDQFVNYQMLFLGYSDTLGEGSKRIKLKIFKRDDNLNENETKRRLL